MLGRKNYARRNKSTQPEQWLRRINHLKFTRSRGRCGQVWEAFTSEFNKAGQDQAMAYPDHGSITIRGARVYQLE
jgi:hypothetical protein